MHFQPKSCQSNEELQYEVQRLSLICEALWDLLKEKNGWEDLDLMQHMARLDMMDGRYDGIKDMPKPPVKCRRCGRMMASKHLTCLYCGEARLQTPF